MAPSSSGCLYAADRARDFDHERDRDVPIRQIYETIDRQSFQWVVVLVAGIGFFLDGYTLFATNIALPKIAYVYWNQKVSSIKETSINIATLAGTLFGQVLFGNATDQSMRTKLIVGTDYGTTYSGVAFSTCRTPEVAVIKDRPGWREEELSLESTHQKEARMRQNANAQGSWSDLQSDANSQAGDLSILDAAELDSGNYEVHTRDAKPPPKQYASTRRGSAYIEARAELGVEDEGVVRAFMRGPDESDVCVSQADKVEAFCFGANLEFLRAEKESGHGTISTLISRTRSADAGTSSQPTSMVNSADQSKRPLPAQKPQLSSLARDFLRIRFDEYSRLSHFISDYMDDTKLAFYPREKGMMFKPVDFEQSYRTIAAAAQPFDEEMDLGTDIGNPVNKFSEYGSQYTRGSTLMCSIASEM